MNFNENQRKAIEITGKNVTVFASAGAGKTTLLIARLIKRMKVDRLGIDEICAMTFTEAAASEMKKRLALALSSEDDPFLKQQLILLPSASISTIHSLCLMIVKNYGYLIALNPERALNILDEGELKQARFQALSQAHLQVMHESVSAYNETLTFFSGNPASTEALDRAVLTLAEGLWEEEDADAARARIIQTYEANAIEELPEALQDLYWTYYQIQIEHLAHLVIECLSAYDACEVNKPQEQAILNSLYSGLLKALQQHKDKDTGFQETMMAILDIQFSRVMKVPAYTEARSRLIESIKTLVEHFYPLNQQFSLLHQSSGVISILLQLADAYTIAFSEAKEQRQGLDFSDLEHLALEILTADGAYASNQLKQRFQEVLVDEYQDTNAIQDRIIQLISNGHNTFRVGDVKQSIYGFRGARPELMRSLLHHRNENHEVLFLSNNYRSKQDIVSFNNALFTQMMRVDVLSDSYGEQDWVETGIAKQIENSEKVEFHLLHALEDDSNDTEPEGNKARKATHIANEMIHYQSLGYSWKDMVVLVRSHATKRDLKTAFEQAAIPYFIDDKSGFYQSLVIQSLLSYYRLALDEGNRRALFTLLSSVFHQFTDEQIARLHLASPKNPLQALSSLFPQTYALIKKNLEMIRSEPIHQSLYHLAQTNDAYQEILSIQDKTNIDFLAEKARDIEMKGTRGLPAFLNTIDILQNEQSSQAIPVSSDDDVVKVMTIHQSKGLQFPLVFFWSTSQRKVQDLSAPLLYNSYLGIALNSFDPQTHVRRKNLLRLLSEFSANAQELEESIRLLYVALTRAQTKMILVDTYSDKPLPDLDNSIVFSSIPYTALILGSITPQNSHVEIKTFENVIPAKAALPAPETVQIIRHHNPMQVSERARASHTVDLSRQLELDFTQDLKSALDYGTMMHHILEHSPEDGWKADTLAKAYPAIGSQQIQDILHLQDDPMTQTLHTGKVHREYSFLVLRDNKPFYGIMDLVVEQESTLILVDYKTDNCSIDDLKQRHQNQIRQYRSVLQELFPGKALRSYLYSFHWHLYLEIEA